MYYGAGFGTSSAPYRRKVAANIEIPKFDQPATKKMKLDTVSFDIFSTAPKDEDIEDKYDSKFLLWFKRKVLSFR